MHRNQNNHPQSPIIAVIFGGFAVCFGIFWTVTAARFAPFMAVFGIFFIAAAVTITLSSYKAAKKYQQDNNRPNENPVYYKQPEQTKPEEVRCPYCGAPIRRGDRECEYCGSEF